MPDRAMTATELLAIERMATNVEWLRGRLSAGYIADFAQKVTALVAEVRRLMADVMRMEKVIRERGVGIEEAFKEGYMEAFDKCFAEERSGEGIDPIMVDDYGVRHEDRRWDVSKARHKYLCRSCKHKARATLTENSDEN